MHNRLSHPIIVLAAVLAAFWLWGHGLAGQPHSHAPAVRTAVVSGHTRP
jgi:hypothetical protein